LLQIITNIIALKDFCIDLHIIISAAVDCFTVNDHVVCHSM